MKKKMYGQCKHKTRITTEHCVRFTRAKRDNLQVYSESSVTLVVTNRSSAGVACALHLIIG